LFEQRFLPRRPDIVLSGINNGHNLGTSVFYSGTVAAAREAASRGIPALAFSAPPEADFQTWVPTAATLARAFAQCSADVSTTPLLNVNFPSVACKGLLVTRVGRQVYEERVIPRVDPNGREYFWIGGRVTEGGEPEGTDAHAVALGYVSVTPLALDSTNADHWETAAQVANALPHQGDKP
jgi:5'-nucleotidase